MGLINFAQITVRLVRPNQDGTGLGDVLLTSLGLTGVMVLIAVVAGIVMAAVLFFWRSRKPLDHSK
jgi:ABC-type phosphate transport system permease subunit